MACFEPVTAFQPFTRSGEPAGRVIFKSASRKPDLTYEVITLPCGKCIGCKQDYRNELGLRAQLEAFSSVGGSCFLTLTYSPEHLPHTPDGKMTLRRSDLVLFLKRLREHFRKRGTPTIRYYSAGEYGDTYGRPHYHLVLFGVNHFSFGDLIVLQADPPLYTTDFLSDLWGKGHVSIGESGSGDAAAYCAKYCMKEGGKADPDRSIRGRDVDPYSTTDYVQPEFARGSQGLGRRWWDNYKDGGIKGNDRIIFRNPDTGKIEFHPMPRYFDKLWSEEDPKGFARVKAKRKAAAEALNIDDVERKRRMEFKLYMMARRRGNKTDALD